MGGALVSMARAANERPHLIDKRDAATLYALSCVGGYTPESDGDSQNGGLKAAPLLAVLATRKAADRAHCATRPAAPLQLLSRFDDRIFDSIVASYGTRTIGGQGGVRRELRHETGRH